MIHGLDAYCHQTAEARRAQALFNRAKQSRVLRFNKIHCGHFKCDASPFKPSHFIASCRMRIPDFNIIIFVPLVHVAVNNIVPISMFDKGSARYIATKDFVHSRTHRALAVHFEFGVRCKRGNPLFCVLVLCAFTTAQGLVCKVRNFYFATLQHNRGLARNARVRATRSSVGKKQCPIRTSCTRNLHRGYGSREVDHHLRRHTIAHSLERSSVSNHTHAR